MDEGLQKNTAASDERRIKRMMRALKAVHSRLDELDLESHRKGQNLLGKVFSPLIGFSFEEFDVNGLPCAFIRPDAKHESKKVLLYCHGGGYTGGNLSYARILGSKLAACCGRDLLAFEYRLSPEHSYPAQLNDAVKAWDFLMRHGYGADDVTLIGESAGGNLALALCLRLKRESRLLPGKLVLMSPWTDLTLSGPSYESCLTTDPMLTIDFLEESAQVFAGNVSRKDPMISPLFADLRGLPKTLLQVGGNELLYSDSARLKDKLIESGVLLRFCLWDEMWHVFQMFPIKEAAEAMDDIGQFIMND